jgi:hypothetical protein
MTARCYTSTPVREVALLCALDALNAARAAMAVPLPPLAADDYWRERLDDLHDSWAVTNRPALLKKALAAFAAAPAEAQGQILALLCMTSYGSLPPAELPEALEAVGLARFLALPPDDQNRCFTLANLGV